MFSLVTKQGQEKTSRLTPCRGHPLHHVLQQTRIDLAEGLLHQLAAAERGRAGADGPGVEVQLGTETDKNDEDLPRLSRSG